jgi:hypothetical protein
LKVYIDCTIPAGYKYTSRDVWGGGTEQGSGRPGEEELEDEDEEEEEEHAVANSGTGPGARRDCLSFQLLA